MTEHVRHIPFVSSETHMAEFTIRALIMGLVMAVIIGAANVYLGLKAGVTIAATYPAAVIGMAMLRAMKGTILEENFARTIASSGYCIASGSIFTIPAFYLAGVWTKFDTLGHYFAASLIMFCGGVLGIMFVAMIRRVMVEDRELPFPESVAAAAIHKAGRTGGTGAKFLFRAMGVGALIQGLGECSFFATSWAKFVSFAKMPISLKAAGTATAQGGIVLSAPAVSPAYIGVGYIIGPKLASLNFSGGLIAWGLLVPIILYFLAPELITQWQVAHPGQVPVSDDWIMWATMVWKSIVRPIAIGGMLVGASFTLFKMRKSLVAGLKKTFGDAMKSKEGAHATARVDTDLNIKWILLGIGLASILTFGIYYYFTQHVLAALVAAAVMIFTGFFFAAISGFLCGTIGSSNNPISGLTISALIIAALLMVAMGMSGNQGIAAVLAVAAVVCVSSSVAGDMFQDLKAGYILGGTPWRMQLGDLCGVAIASLVMFLPLIILHQGDINAGKMALHPYDGGFGSMKLPAVQAGLMAFLAQGIVGGNMAWPLIIVGMMMGVGFILMQVRSPMLVSIGMYLPLETTFAIFVGGIIKGIVTMFGEKKKLNEAQQARVENTGILIAAGLIAGESLFALVLAGFAFANIPLWVIFKNPSFLTSLIVFFFIAWYLIAIPLKHAGRADQPAPPRAAM